MVSLSTYGGWAGIALVGAGYWYLQSRRTTNRTNRSVPQKLSNKAGDARKEGKSKKQRTESTQSGGERGTSSQDKSPKKKKQKVAQPNVEDTTPVPTATLEDIKEDEDVNNQEFARQFQNAKSGTISASRPSVASRQKSVKQSQAKDTSTFNHVDGIETSSNDVSKTSSSAEVDGDDDLSEANSPHLEATPIKTLRGGDVSDMLESTAGGPSILRITEPTTYSQPKRETKATKPSEVTETKKQRQNKKKAEAKKDARAEDEKERRMLLEQQRRTAREAEGRPAKDGSNFMAGKAPVSSVWSAQLTTVNGPTASVAKDVELLDTYEPNINGATKLLAKTPNAADDKKAGGDWDEAIPSEEEQMRLLEEETAWNTVTGKKGKKKGSESEQGPASKVTGNDKLSTNPSVATSVNEAHKNAGSVTIVGDPTIDMSNFSYKGGPVNAVLEDSHGREYGYKMTDDEWEVA